MTGRTLQPEDVIAHYKVVGPLGVGGMGEVYLAQDQNLERNVALKVLPAEYVQDDERLRRFVLEAKSASSLSHPNIVTIYEIGRDVVRSKGGAAEPDSGPLQYISMELISGRTLSTLIHEEKTDLRTLIGYLAQAAEGLAKAHAAGIVHRDLKPGNIMVSADGFAKILDFGLAKLTERREGEPEPDLSSAPTRLEQRTGAGMILGTTAYMSPEQVRGKPVDHRSDIFSFGCVLYEAATRTRPFVAETAVETMHKILHDTPVPIEERNPKAPAELRRLVRRCLAKSPDQRLQSMKDIALELREIADEWDTLSSSSATTATAVRGPGGQAPKSRTGVILGAVGLVAVAAIVVAVWAVRRAPTQEPSQPFQTMRMSTQTNRGDVTEAAISRDGRYLAYLTGAVGESSVRVRQVATGSDLEVVPSQEGLFEGLSFSPDGNYLFYLKRRRDAPSYRALVQVPSLGGASKEVAFDVDSRATFSPDAKRIAYFRGDPVHQRSLLIVRDLESGKEQEFAAVKGSHRFFAPDWSPDGSQLAIPDLDQSAGGLLATLALYDVPSGRRTDLRTLKGGTIESAAWLPDGSGLVTSGFDLGLSIARQVAFVAYPGGATRRVTNDVSDYTQVTVSGGAEAIAAVRKSTMADLWIADANGGEPRPLTALRNAENSPINVAACRDGSVVFAAPRDQAVVLWSIGPGGGAPRALTGSDVLSVRPFCVSDGIVHDRYDADGTVRVWAIGFDGGNPRSISPNASSQILDVQRGGRYVVIGDQADQSVWGVSLDGGAPVKLGSGTGFGRVSPDGSRVLTAALEIRPDGLSGRSLRVVSARDASMVAKPAIPAQADGFEWAADGNAILFVDQSQTVWNVWRAPLDGAKPEPITRFTDGRVTLVERSPDGRRIAVARKIGGSTNVWVCAADGSNPVQVTRFPLSDVFQVHWMADGAHLVVNAGTRSSEAVLIRDFR